MAYEDDGDTLIFETANEFEYLGHLADADCRRRLIHEHDFGVRQPRARDRNGLTLAA